MYDWLGKTVEEIRKELDKLPIVDPALRAECSFTGSGMTEHGFMVGSGDCRMPGDPIYENGEIVSHWAVPCDEAQTIFNSINAWNEDGTRRK
jgi:hypothetical protein